MTRSVPLPMGVLTLEEVQCGTDGHVPRERVNSRIEFDFGNRIVEGIRPNCGLVRSGAPQAAHTPLVILLRRTRPRRGLRDGVPRSDVLHSLAHER